VSGKQTGKVWDLDLPFNEAWVLMALADDAHHDGTNCFPGDERLAWKTGYSVRTVKRMLALLREHGLVEVVHMGGGRGHKTEYVLHLDRGPQKPPPGTVPNRHGSETVSGPSRNGDSPRTQTVSPPSRNGDTHARACKSREDPNYGSVMDPNPPSRALVRARERLPAAREGGPGAPIVIPAGTAPRDAERLALTAERLGVRAIHEATTKDGGSA
jgi:hypothetical protein